MNNVIYIVLGLMIVGLAVWIFMGSKKRKWYKVYLANNDVMLLYRDLNERWWRTSDRYMRFKDEYGREITFPSNAHWILMWESVPDNAVEKARIEIRRMRENKAKEVSE